MGHPNAGLPTNILSEKRYRGINVLLLHLHQLRYGLKSKYFGTFNQWKGLAAHVRPRPSNVPPGQWGRPINFFKPITKIETDENGEEQETGYAVLRTYTVFGIDQVEGAHLDRFRVGDLSVSIPFFVAGGIKVLYDLFLYRSFVTLRAPEEERRGTEARSDL